jgi:hypothetical protein
MDHNPGHRRTHFTQEELAAMWRGRLTLEDCAAIKKETDDLINGWKDNLSAEESDARSAARVKDLERELRQKLGFLNKAQRPARDPDNSRTVPPNFTGPLSSVEKPTFPTNMS